ncbi:MAG: biosynthetic peptidoglycan transglycosylase [Gemmatimonadota bacterium]
MRVCGPAEDGTYGGPPPYGDYDTTPFARPGHWEWVDDGPYGPAQNGNGHLNGYRPRRRRRFRFLRRLMTLVIGFALLGALALGGLLLVTPSAGTAEALARAIDQSHHAPFPGPPVAPRFAAALTATEDHRFYSEPGIDPFGVARLVYGTVTRQPDQGGATLYQQLAKMLYTSGAGGLSMQAVEVGVGIKLYLTYSRQQILRMYQDVAYFGHGYYGLAQAACGYFAVQPAQLSWPQAAMLAGLVQAPSADDPLLHYANARARESHVLGRLTAVGTLTPAQASAAWQQSLNLVQAGGRCA